MHYSYQATDSVTGEVHGWTSETPDPTGTSYPGPNSPLAILQTNDPPTGTMTAGRGYAVSDAVGKAAVANVAALRADPDLILAGSIRLDSHTVPGWGGGDLYWDAASTEADNNGTIFAVTGVTTGRWKRSGCQTGPVLVDWFGAAGTFEPSTETGFDSTAAIQAAVAYVSPSIGKKSLQFSGGCYKLTSPILLQNNWTVSGTGLWSTQLWGSSAGVFVLGAPGATYPFIYAQAIVIRDLWICGPADCGGRAIWVPHCLLHFDIKVACTGGYEYGFYCGIPDSHGEDAALQWGDLSMFSTWSQSGLSAAWAMPTNYFYSDGYFNACKMRFEIRRSLGVAITCIGEYAGADYSEITGSVQECGQAVSLLNVGKLIFRNFYSEGDGATPIVCTNSRPIFENGASGIVTLIGCQDTQFRNWQGPYSEDANTSGTRTVNSAIAPIHRVNNSAVMPGGAESANFDTDRRFDIPGFGDADPPNIVPNGDFSRWISASKPAGWYSNFSGVKCGDGCTDTTRTKNAPNCARIESVGGSTFVRVAIPAPAQQFLGAQFSYQFKGKIATGNIGYAVTFGEELLSYGDEDRKIACEDGFSTYSVCCRITQDMIDHGIMLCFTSTGGATFYLSELSASYGSLVPRHFERVSNVPAKKATILPSGNIEIYSATIPVASTDPIFGEAWIAGDRALSTTGTASTTEGGVGYATHGWIYNGSSWVQLQVLTALASTGNHLLDIQQEAKTTSNVALTTNSATELLAVAPAGLAVSSTYLATVGARVVMWKSTDLAVCGTIDLTTDVRVVTDGSGVVTCYPVGDQYPDASRLTATMAAGSTIAVAAVTGGFDVTATRPTDTSCVAKARVWVHRFEKLELPS